MGTPWKVHRHEVIGGNGNGNWKEKNVAANGSNLFLLELMLYLLLPNSISIQPSILVFRLVLYSSNSVWLCIWLCISIHSIVYCCLYVLSLYLCYLVSWPQDWINTATTTTTILLQAKVGMVHSVSGCTRAVQVKLWYPLRTHAIPECLRGVFTTRRYTNPH